MPLNRPLLLRLLPPRLRLSARGRLYRGRHDQWRGLYQDASLSFAPGVTMELVPGDVISDDIAFTGVYELALTRRVVELARIGGTMVEVGANLGYFTLLWTATNPTNACCAFEPSPRNIEILQGNVARNGLASRVEIVPCAAGASRGRLKFDIGPEDQTGWGGFTAGQGSRTIDVDVVRIDEFVGPTVAVDLLKIDTEGADTWALEGCASLLKAKRVGEIWYEQNKPRMQALGVPLTAAEQYLASCGYRAEPQSDPAGDTVEWSARASS
jgi:FkbM family methyltransferase